MDADGCNLCRRQRSPSGQGNSRDAVIALRFRVGLSAVIHHRSLAILVVGLEKPLKRFGTIVCLKKRRTIRAKGSNRAAAIPGVATFRSWAARLAQKTRREGGQTGNAGDRALLGASVGDRAGGLL